MADNAIRRLAECSQSTAPAAKRVEAAISLTEELFKKGDVEGIQALIDHVFGPDSGGMLLCRSVVRAAVTGGESTTSLTSQQLESLWSSLLNYLLRHSGVYEEEEVTVRQHLSDLFRSTGRLVEAARCLADMRWSVQGATPLKLEFIVQAAELFSNAGDVKEAEVLLHRAVVLAMECEKQVDLQYRIQVLQARLADLTHQYLEAARRYLDLAKSRASEPEASQFLLSATTCSILSPAGPKRSKVLSMLLKQGCELREYEVVERVLSERLIRGGDLRALKETLQPHQRAPDVEGVTPMDRAFRDHSMHRFGDGYAERTAARMIQQGRLLDAVIDGEKGFLRFGEKEFTPLEDANSRLAEIFRRLDSVF